MAMIRMPKSILKQGHQPLHPPPMPETVIINGEPVPVQLLYDTGVCGHLQANRVCNYGCYPGAPDPNYATASAAQILGGPGGGQLRLGPVPQFNLVRDTVIINGEWVPKWYLQSKGLGMCKHIRRTRCCSRGCYGPDPRFEEYDTYAEGFDEGYMNAAFDAGDDDYDDDHEDEGRGRRRRRHRKHHGRLTRRRSTSRDRGTDYLGYELAPPQLELEWSPQYGWHNVRRSHLF